MGYSKRGKAFPTRVAPVQIRPHRPPSPRSNASCKDSRTSRARFLVWLKHNQITLEMMAEKPRAGSKMKRQSEVQLGEAKSGEKQWRWNAPRPDTARKLGLCSTLSIALFTNKANEQNFKAFLLNTPNTLIINGTE